MSYQFNLGTEVIALRINKVQIDTTDNFVNFSIDRINLNTLVVEKVEIAMQGEEFISLATTLTSNETLYEEIKNAAWPVLISGHKDELSGTSETVNFVENV